MTGGEFMAWEVGFYETEGGRCPVEDFLDGLPVKARAKCVKYIELLEEHGFGLPANYAKRVAGTDALWELRPEYGGVEYRLLYFSLIKNRLVVVHAVTKKTRRLDPNDIRTAERRIREMKSRGKGKGDR